MQALRWYIYSIFHLNIRSVSGVLTNLNSRNNTIAFSPTVTVASYDKLVPSSYIFCRLDIKQLFNLQLQSSSSTAFSLSAKNLRFDLLHPLSPQEQYYELRELVIITRFIDYRSIRQLLLPPTTVGGESFSGLSWWKENGPILRQRLSD